MQKFSAVKDDPTFLEPFQALDEVNLRELATAIDESIYPIEEWVEAFYEFQSWNEKQAKAIPLSHQIEYLSCCAEGVSKAGKLMSLADVLKMYLEQEGVEKS